VQTCKFAGYGRAIAGSTVAWEGGGRKEGENTQKVLLIISFSAELGAGACGGHTNRGSENSAWHKVLVSQEDVTAAR